MTSPLVGSWEMISDTDVGMAIIGESHYSAIRMSKNRKKPEGQSDASPEV